MAQTIHFLVEALKGKLSIVLFRNFELMSITICYSKRAKGNCSRVSFIIKNNCFISNIYRNLAIGNKIGNRSEI